MHGAEHMMGSLVCRIQQEEIMQSIHYILISYYQHNHKEYLGNNWSHTLKCLLLAEQYSCMHACTYIHTCELRKRNMTIRANATREFEKRKETQ